MIRYCCCLYVAQICLYKDFQTVNRNDVLTIQCVVSLKMNEKRRKKYIWRPKSNAHHLLVSLEQNSVEKRGGEEIYKERKRRRRKKTNLAIFICNVKLIASAT